MNRSITSLIPPLGSSVWSLYFAVCFSFISQLMPFYHSDHFNLSPDSHLPFLIFYVPLVPHPHVCNNPAFLCWNTDNCSVISVYCVWSCFIVQTMGLGEDGTPPQCLSCKSLALSGKDKSNAYFLLVCSKYNQFLAQKYLFILMLVSKPYGQTRDSNSKL